MRRFIHALGLSLGLASASEAAPITWAFHGTVRIVEVGATPELAGSLGAPVSGYVRYRDDVFSLGGPVAGIFDGAVLGFGVAIGDDPEGGYESLGCCFFDVNLNPVSGGGSIGIFGLGIPPNGFFPNGAPASLSLIADTPGVIADIVHIPQAPPPLAALRPFSIADWSQSYSGTGLKIGAHADTGWPDGRIVVELTSLARVPEPAVAALIALLLAFAALLRSRSSKLAPGYAASRPRSGRAGAAIRRGS